MNPETANKLDRQLKALLWLCVAAAALGMTLLALGHDIGMWIAFGAMGIASAPAFHFAAKVAFTEPPRNDQN
jgi:hypothetical protein